jgi:XapX domain-containing protein
MPFLVSLGAGLAVGLLYYLVRVQSPAPPLIALSGLLGIVVGEHAIPFVQAHIRPATAQTQNEPPAASRKPTSICSKDQS